MSLSRRHVVFGTALASLAQTQETVRTAVIGTGGRGSYLLTGILQQPDVKVTALCDIKPERVDKAASSAARDNPATTREWKSIVERPDVDAVYIATPPHLHSEMAVAALKAGKHVYCEKPIGITGAQIRDVVAAARASKRVFTAGQQLRSMKPYMEAVRRIREGVIGDVIMVKAQRHAVMDLPHDGTSGDWYFDVTKSGGYLIEQSVHNLDLCNWAIGARPTRACGFGGIGLYKNEPPGRSIYDFGSLTYDYPGGVKMSFTQNVFHPRALPFGNQYVYIYGTKGAIDLLGAPVMHPLGPPAPSVPLADKESGNPHAHTVMFYDAIRKGGPNPSGIDIGATAALTAILGHEAMTKERVVTWAELGVEL